MFCLLMYAWKRMEKKDKRFYSVYATHYEEYLHHCHHHHLKLLCERKTEKMLSVEMYTECSLKHQYYGLHKKKPKF